MPILVALLTIFAGCLALAAGIITGGRIIEGVARGWSSTGAPVAGTNEVQTLTIGGTPTAGSFTLRYDGYTTAAIPWSAVNGTLLASINSALDALSSIGTAGVVATAGTLTAGIGTILLTFSGGSLAKRAVATMVAVSSLTGTSPTAVVTETTPGVDATGIGAPVGAILTRDNGTIYANTGTALAPTWTVIGSQV